MQSQKKKKKERKQKDRKILWFYQRAEKSIKLKRDGVIRCSWGTCNDHRRFRKKKTVRIGNQRKSWDYPDYNIVKIH